MDRRSFIMLVSGPHAGSFLGEGSHSPVRVLRCPSGHVLPTESLTPPVSVRCSCGGSVRIEEEGSLPPVDRVRLGVESAAADRIDILAESLGRIVGETIGTASIGGFETPFGGPVVQPPMPGGKRRRRKRSREDKAFEDFLRSGCGDLNEDAPRVDDESHLRFPGRTEARQVEGEILAFYMDLIADIKHLSRKAAAHRGTAGYVPALDSDLRVLHRTASRLVRRSVSGGE